ncbi:MAG: hypothetical protein U9Q70_04975 [Chloroflexota bacterium]|nr:hypothetical protein [Chloroflexota bacterium]
MLKLRPVHILVFVVALVLLGALAWGVGWAAHSLVGGERAATATPTAILTPSLTVATTPTAGPTQIPAKLATSTPQPTSTPMSTLTPPPVEEWETVRQGEGLYQICRRHCPGRWPGTDVPSSLDAYAREVARMNGLRWGWRGPQLHKGQKLQMLPCP